MRSVRSLRSRRDLGDGDQLGIVQLFGERGQIVRHGERPEVCENVQNPVMLHRQTLPKAVNERLTQL
jgi:hypothetical protein